MGSIRISRTVTIETTQDQIENAGPARFLASHIFEFGNIPTKTHHATVDILNAFFYGALNDKLPDLDSIAGRHQGIIGN